LAIYSTRHLSCAHLNPAVSIAMVLSKRMRVGKLPIYLTAQFSGAFVAACVIYLLFSDSITVYETAHGIVRGTPQSVPTAMIFGEFFPNPGVKFAVVSHLTAFLGEGLGTFALMFLILSLTEDCNLGRPSNILAPLFIGLSVSVLICVVAPLTQAGFNPARDLSPRLFAAVAGWGQAAFPEIAGSFFTVYVIAPIMGASTAGLMFSWIIQPIMNRKNKSMNCTREDC
ncbi:MAG: aquaporin family protein, partial [Oligoflexia bacterium]|nr:aquaporin family protein [Oligoflexia bacterium]